VTSSSFKAIKAIPGVRRVAHSFSIFNFFELFFGRLQKKAQKKEKFQCQE
jgi:hypothetical protein